MIADALHDRIYEALQDAMEALGAENLPSLRLAITRAQRAAWEVQDAPPGVVAPLLPLPVSDDVPEPHWTEKGGE